MLPLAVLPGSGNNKTARNALWSSCRCQSVQALLLPSLITRRDMKPRAHVIVGGNAYDTNLMK
ncbi:hypothetical protein BN135_3371 [Cronobacter muytjensii 530]